VWHSRRVCACVWRVCPRRQRGPHTRTHKRKRILTRITLTVRKRRRKRRHHTRHTRHTRRTRNRCTLTSTHTSQRWSRTRPSCRHPRRRQTRLLCRDAAARRR